MTPPATTPLLLVRGRRRRHVALATFDAINAAITKFERDLGGRQALVAALAVTDLSEDLEALLSVLGDPANDLRSLAEICADHKLAPADVIRSYKQAILGRAQVLALASVADALPQVVADLATRSVTHQALCEPCHGSGKVRKLRKQKDGTDKVCEEDCLSCAGVGTIRQAADPAAQDKLLDMGGLLQKGGPGIAVGVNVHTHAAPSSGSGGSLTDLQHAVTKILSSPAPSVPVSPPPVDGELLPSRETGVDSGPT